MIKSLILFVCFLSLQAHARPSDQLQTLEIKQDALLQEGLPFIAIRTKEAGVTYDSDRFEQEVNEFALGKAQKRADQFCHNMNYLHADTVKLSDLAAVENVEAWLIDGEGSAEVVSEERRVSQLSWISLIGGSIAYREPMIFKHLSCVK